MVVVSGGTSAVFTVSPLGKCLLLGVNRTWGVSVVPCTENCGISQPVVRWQRYNAVAGVVPAIGE